MALPVSWTQVKVYGTYLRLDGTPNAGQIWFDSASPVNVIDDNGDTVLVVPKRITVDINENGYFEVMLPATSDPDLDPKGWTYQVKERITGGLEYSIDVPHDLVSLNLVPMRPKAPDTPLEGTINYLTTEDLGNTVARQGDVNTLTTLVSTAQADATNAINTANATATTANQAAETANAASAIANSLGDQINAATDTADAASAAASAAQTAAGQAQTDATSALTTANGLSDQVTQASSDAAAAQAAASAAQTAASDAQTAASGALDTANGLADDVASANTAATNALNTANSLKTDLANQSDTAKGTAMIGHQGQTLADKIASMDANIAAGGGGGGGGGSYVPPFSGSTTRSFQAKLNDQPVNMLDFYKATDGNNYTPAINRALGASLHVCIPIGTWRLASPITMVEHMNLEGANTCNWDAGSATSTWGTVLNCPQGGILNPDKGGGQPARKHIFISNLAFDGDSSGKTCIDGEFGGYVVGCAFQGFAYAIRNLECFLLRIERCTFNSCSTCAVYMADFNGGTIRECAFQSSCAKHIDLTPTGPEGIAASQGYPYIITENLFNAGAASQANQVLVSLRGIVEFSNNYYEDFASAAQGTSWVEVLCSASDHTAFSIRYNEANAHGKSRHAFIVRYIGGGTDVHGEIYGNRFSGGWNDPNWPIHFGDVGAETNSTVGGVVVYGNGGMDVQGQIAPGNGKPYRPIYHTKWSGSINVSGGTDINIPVGTSSTSGFDARGNSQSGVNTALVDKSGIWRVTVVGTFDDAATTMVLTRSGTTIESVTGSKQLTLEYTGPLDGGQLMAVKAHGGTNALALVYTQQWICPQDCWS